VSGCECAGCMWLAVLCIVNELSGGIEFEEGLDHVSL
jgi:hypothetical protein